MVNYTTRLIVGDQSSTLGCRTDRVNATFSPGFPSRFSPLFPPAFFRKQAEMTGLNVGILRSDGTVNFDDFECNLLTGKRQVRTFVSTYRNYVIVYISRM